MDNKSMVIIRKALQLSPDAFDEFIAFLTFLSTLVQDPSDAQIMS